MEGYELIDSESFNKLANNRYCGILQSFHFQSFTFFIRLLEMVTLYLFKKQQIKIFLMLFMKMEFWMFEAQIKKKLWLCLKALRKIFFNHHMLNNEGKLYWVVKNKKKNP